jgi:hypothetical protein
MMMNKLTIFGVVLALSLGATEIATAQTKHSHGTQPSDKTGSSAMGQKAPVAGNQADMMQNMMSMMMQMHAGMMGTNEMPGMSMMDKDMMKLMMGPGMMARPSAEALGTALQSRLTEFDVDGNGRLSLDEFDALHAAMTRETMVDQFQYLDADGNGQITKDEMTAPSRRMKMLGMNGDGNDIMNGNSKGAGN